LSRGEVEKGKQAIGQKNRLEKRATSQEREKGEPGEKRRLG